MMNEEQYYKALQEVDKLMDIDPVEGTEEREEFDILVKKIMEYENLHYPIPM